jgi:hypothetical protein
MQEASASDNGDKGYLVTIASVAPDSVGSSHVRAFVLPYFPQNTARAPNASAVISPNPLGYEARYWRRRAFDIDRCALQVPYVPFQYASLPASGRGIGVTWQIPFQPPLFEKAVSAQLDFLCVIFRERLSATGVAHRPNDCLTAIINIYVPTTSCLDDLSAMAVQSLHLRCKSSQ